MNTTLLGGKTITIQREPVQGTDQPRVETVTVRQVRVRDYEAGFRLHADEIGLVGFLAGRDRLWALDLLPESFEAILAEGRAVNERGFFAFCRRRIEVMQAEQIQMSAALAKMPEDVRTLILAEGAKAMASTGSPGSSSPPPRPRA